LPRLGMTNPPEKAPDRDGCHGGPQLLLAVCITLGPERGLDFPEMAMKNKLIPGTIVLLLVSWFALDAVAAILA
jgi:hypothetical protein